MIFKAPPQFGQCSMSKTPFEQPGSSCAPARPALEVSGPIATRNEERLLASQLER